MKLDHDEKSTSVIGYVGITHGTLSTGEGFESVTLIKKQKAFVRLGFSPQNSGNSTLSQFGVSLRCVFWVL